MINAIKLPGLRNGEYAQFLTDVLKIVQEADPVALNVKAQFDVLSANHQLIESLFKQVKGSIITAELTALDVRRDNAFLGISSIINGHLYSTKAEVKKAAELLANHLKAFGADVARDNMQSETASLRNISDDWTKKPDLAAAITLLGLDDWKTELDAANTLFGNTYVSRAKEQGTASQDTITAKRNETNEAYYQLRDEIGAWFTIKKGAEPYGTTVKFLNGIVDNYNNLLSRRAPEKEGGLAQPPTLQQEALTAAAPAA